MKERLTKSEGAACGEDSPFNNGAGKAGRLLVKEQTWGAVSQRKQKQAQRGLEA